jgi:hypothetical protein
MCSPHQNRHRPVAKQHHLNKDGISLSFEIKYQFCLFSLAGNILAGPYISPESHVALIPATVLDL